MWDVVNIDNDIEMRWCRCGEYHWDEMMLMMIMTSRWDHVDVDDVIVMMYVVYVHGGCNDQVGCPWWEK